MYDDAYLEFKKAEQTLRNQAWFQDGWTLSVSSADKLETGVAIQFSKSNWFNEDGKGIHYETWVTEEQLKHQELGFVMHVLHQPTFPGTVIKPASFMSRFRTRNKARIESWGLCKSRGWEPRSIRYGYYIATGNMTAFDCHRGYAACGIATVIIDEFTRFTELGPSIDTILAEVLKKTG